MQRCKLERQFVPRNDSTQPASLLTALKVNVMPNRRDRNVCCFSRNSRMRNFRPVEVTVRLYGKQRRIFISDKNPRIYKIPNCVQTFATEAYNVELLLRVALRDGRQAVD